eukprot:scaffold11416_cov422-Ochromonas_danica.AAC.1
MDIEPEIAAILIKMHPEVYQRYLQLDGRLTVKLERALYGYIESALLFYEHLSSTLKAMGFEPNPYDICVFNKMINGKQCTLTVHVDDLKISSQSREAIQEVINDLKKTYKNVSINEGKILDYLGMEFGYSVPGQVKISMKAMVEQVLQDYDDVTHRAAATTPATFN